MCLHLRDDREKARNVNAASIVTALHLPEFKTAVRNRVEYEGAKKDPNKVIISMDRLKTKWQILEKYEAGRKEARHKAASKGDARRAGKAHRAMLWRLLQKQSQGHLLKSAGTAEVRT